MGLIAWAILIGAIVLYISIASFVLSLTVLPFLAKLGILGALLVAFGKTLLEIFGGRDFGE